MRRGVLLVVCMLVVASLAAFRVEPLAATTAASTSAGAASASPVEALLVQCPPSAEIATFNADLAISFEGDPTAGTLVCHASAGSADLTRFQERVYQALRVMKATRFTRALPWTSMSLYDWFTSTIDAIRIRDDITFSFCCDPPGAINILASPNSVALYTNRWFDSSSRIGLAGLVGLFVHEARHNDGLGHTCGNDDQTTTELGSWGAQYYLHLWQALYSGTFLNSPDVYPSYYRDQHLRTSQDTLTRICTLPDADLWLGIRSPEAAVPGAPVALTLTAENAGPDTAGEVYVYSPVPADTTVAAVSASQGSCTAARDGPLACSLGAMEPGGTAQVTVSLMLDVGSTATQLTNKEAPAALGARVTGPVHDTNFASNGAFFSIPVQRHDATTLLRALIGGLHTLGLAPRLDHSLAAKLRAALKKLERDRSGAACRTLDTFAKRVSTLQATGRLTADQGARLLEGGRGTQAAIPCA